MAAAVEDLYGIPRHGDGATRVNAGVVGGGTATNIVAEEAFVRGEVRGETTALKDYMEERAETVLRAAADKHGCEVTVEFGEGAPSAECDDRPVAAVAAAGEARGATVLDGDEDALGGSEDATRLMRAVQESGGEATYVGIGSSNPTGHHTAKFDVDEDSIPLAVDVLADAIHSTAGDS